MCNSDFEIMERYNKCPLSLCFWYCSSAIYQFLKAISYYIAGNIIFKKCGGEGLLGAYDHTELFKKRPTSGTIFGGMGKFDITFKVLFVFGSQSLEDYIF